MAAMSDDELKDRIAIADRLAAAAQAGDARKADAYAECFTADGVLQLDREIAGREAIRAWMAGAVIIPAARTGSRGASPGYVSHHLTTSKVSLTGTDSAAARTYWLVTSAAGLDHNGYYDDVLRKEDGVWRLAHRRPRTLWISPASVLHG